MSQTAPYPISYGPDENCVLDQSSPYYCPASASVYGYRPALSANITFLVLFFVTMVIHFGQGMRWRTWNFMIPMVLGCLCEIIGYGGRILLYQDPFSFAGFLMQIICITIGPAFFSASIYFTLSRIVNYLGPEHSRLKPNLYYWIFIPCDIVSLSLQASGGALSSISSGSSKVGVDVAIAGLGFQVFTLTVFIMLAVDFGLRYLRAGRLGPKREVSRRFKVFVAFLTLAITLILIRCAYRIDELSDGYYGPLIHNEGLFIGLEGVMIIVATFCLNMAQPGPVFGGVSGSNDRRLVEDDQGGEMAEERKSAY